ncbi:hypothetical protein [Yoonia sp. BS5-3]|uniref:Translation initiation factor 2 n=1 Tax=Yoonia phaeophyticola TaxID=3137369 RepID=A0ABZ2V4R8_9RHOB
MKKLTMIAAALLVTGCTSPIEITGEDVTARIRDGVNRDRLTSYRPMEVRSFVTQNGQQIELAGLPCELTSDEITANIVTPARVNLPRFVQSGEYEDRGRPGQMQIRCEGGGYEGAETIFAQDKQVGTATNAGIGGAILTTVVTAAIASSTPWQYPPATRVPVRAE